VADAASREPRAGVVEDLAQVRQEPDVATLGDSLPDDFAGDVGFAKARSSNQDRRP
jgi:hypothetical protein